MKNILVIGGAGYIGSNMCKHLARAGYYPITLDNLVYGHREAVKWGPLIEGSMADPELLQKIFKTYRISAVMHFAAFCYVGESVKNPGRYYQNNVVETINLLRYMVESKINNFIFSSSCATYGEPVEIPISEDHPQNPINPYGRTKLMVEQVLDDFKNAYGLKYVSLRYFNAAGADPEGELGEDHNPETHLIPLILQTALGKTKQINVFGDDYPTRDGTCIRDYIHIYDICQAHLLSLKMLLDGHSSGIFNLGNGDGYSVMDIINTACKITKKKIPVKVVNRRPGDPAILIGSSQKVRSHLGWEPVFSELEVIVQHAWHWHKNHANGYKS